MLVKKYEAQSIKQAIELVKTELGPEAIILGAREHNANFGLGGTSSVEVTAAISENKYRDKINAEKKMNNQRRENYHKSSAKNQKEFIQKAMGAKHMDQYQMLEKAEPAAVIEKAVPRPATNTRYIDIPEEEMAVPIVPDIENTVASIEAIRQAMHKPQPQNQAQAQPQPAPVRPAQDTSQISALKQEIHHLKGLIEKFQSVPQGFVSAHPGAEYGVSYELSHSFKKLVDGGVDEEQLIDIFKNAEEALPIQQKKKRAFVEGWLIRQFLDRVKVVNKPDFGKYHVFVGPTGQGKTSTVVKFASQLVLKQKKKVAVLSGDTLKVGARDQLKIYCQILNVPFGVIDRDVDWKALNEKLKDFDHVLIDTGGVNLRGANDIDFVRRCLPRGFEHDMRTHFVQSIMARDKDAFEVADRFKLFNFNDVIFTRLDEAVQYGFIYNFSQRYAVPVHSFGTGSDVPECFEFASKERMIDLLFGLSKKIEERG